MAARSAPVEVARGIPIPYRKVTTQHGNLGLIYQTRGELDRAEEMYHKALALFKAVDAAPSMKQVQAWLDGLNESRAER